MSCFSKVFEKSSEFENLSRSMSSASSPVGVNGLSDINKVHIIHSLIEEKGQKALVVLPDEASAVKFAENLGTFQDDVLFYPSKEITLAEVAGVSKEFEHIRIGVLSKMLAGEYSAVVCSVSAASQLTIPPEVLKNHIFSIAKGDCINVDEICEKLVSSGYSRYDQVEGTSQFALRGGILDLFPPHLSEPVRIELWGDVVDTISSFDIATQRRTGNLQSITVSPSNEVLFKSKEFLAKKIDNFASELKGKATKAREKLYDDSEKLLEGVSLPCYDKYISLCYDKETSLFDYSNDMLFVIESVNVKSKIKNQQKLFNEEIKWLLGDGNIAKGLEKFTISFEELVDIYENKKAVYLDDLPRGSFDTPVSALINFSCQSFNAWSGTLAGLKEELEPLVKNGYTVCIMAGTKRACKALAYDIEEMGYSAYYAEELPERFQKGTITVISGTLSAGFQYSNLKFALISHSKTAQIKKKRKNGSMKNAIHSLDEISVGDYIVHNVHGIGVFEGVHPLEINKVKKDYIKISYAKGDTLYVPVTQLDLVSKYIGPRDDSKVKINRLGSDEWKKAKAKVRSSVKDMAKELIALYAKRMSTKGYAFSEDTDLQRDFELRFQYDETDDQLRCSEEIKTDMQKTAPMDRLLCGDVGFGKTEVALRSAFKCIGDGKQCAILVPTTVLAMQHFSTAKKRMEAYPVRVEMISRFVSPTKQKQIQKDLENGQVDLLIGTHRLISKDVKFKDLGLLIVDEEQRFGVAQKEKLKEKFPRVDVLTLSATPIPRTLNMAMSGIRDMSLIEEAPGDRHPVQTYVMEHDFGVLTEAMEKELSRGGQVYYLHNNIDTIEHKAMQIKKEIPDANVGIAHGRMTEEQLSDVWQKLLDGELDILVCTTIIETGVDIPNVNTLIIENADRMGLAQLHQIRGRVGRSSRRAFAYFTFTRGKELTEIASKRLSAIREYTEFGSGFKIAMRDLEIRGAGSILGSRQHGHMESVGYDMYLKLLEEAVQEEKGEKKEDVEEKECLIDLPVDAHIPDEYISSTPQRLGIYKRIANVKTNDDANDVLDELKDRFGNPPSSVMGLVEIALLRNTAQKLKIYEIAERNGSILFYVNDINMNYVVALNKEMKGRILLSAGKKAYIAVKIGAETPIETVSAVLKILENE